MLIRGLIVHHDQLVSQQDSAIATTATKAISRPIVNRTRGIRIVEPADLGLHHATAARQRFIRAQLDVRRARVVA